MRGRFGDRAENIYFKVRNWPSRKASTSHDAFVRRERSTPPRWPLSRCVKASVRRVSNRLSARQLHSARLLLRFFGTYGDAIHPDCLDPRQDRRS